MPTVVLLATNDVELASIWEKQLPAGRIALRIEADGFISGISAGLLAIIIVDATFAGSIPTPLIRCPTIFVGEPRTKPFEQARLNNRAKVYLSYKESSERLGELIPLVEEIAEKQSLIEMVAERGRKSEVLRAPARPAGTNDFAEVWDFLEGAIENIDTRDRLIAEFRRASRHLLRASHAVFFFREPDGFRADRGTSYFPTDDPLVAFFERHPAVIDGTSWDSPADPMSELAVRNRLALWGARLLVPIHDNGRLLGVIALGVRDDGQAYEDSDRNRAVFFARLLKNFLLKSIQYNRLSHITHQIALAGKYLPGTLVLEPDEAVPRHVPLVVRDLVGQVRRNRQVCRAAPCGGQPFRVSAGIIAETGGVWAFWEEASGEIYDARARDLAGRREVLRELALTLSHELGNALVSLATFRQAQPDRPLPLRLIETMKADVSQLESLNKNLSLMQTFHEVDSAEIDVREVAQEAGQSTGLRVEVGPDPVVIKANKKLLVFTLDSFIRAVVDPRPQKHEELALKVRSTGSGAESTALISLKGKNLELEGVLPEPAEGSVPNLGRMSVFLAKEIVRLHNGEIHAGPGMEGTEILISLKSW